MNIYDISRRAGVSIATVSRVLNNSPHVSETTRKKVLAVIEGTGYVPNAFARGLGLNTMKTIGLLCPDASDPYLAQALAFLERSFRQMGYDCLLSCTGRELAARQQGVELLRSRHVDGIVLMGSTFIEDSSMDNDYIREAARNVPVILLNGSFSCENVYWCCAMISGPWRTPRCTCWIRGGNGYCSCITPPTIPAARSWLATETPMPSVGLRWTSGCCAISGRTSPAYIR